jgi:hypothetical protein
MRDSAIASTSERSWPSADFASLTLVTGRAWQIAPTWSGREGADYGWQTERDLRGEGAAYGSLTVRVVFYRLTSGGYAF